MPEPPPPYVGEIRMFAGNFAPAGWMFCDGSLLPISENEVLYVVIGTTFGGDGENTFALPDLRGRIPIHAGNGRVLGEMGGQESVTLAVQHLPQHAHGLVGTTSTSDASSPAGTAPAAPTTLDLYRPSTTPAATMATGALQPSGQSQPHHNMQPYLCVNFIISLFGIFPSPT